ncbi:aldo/keto reductase [Sinorhizobium sp. BG8]|uniref:aldo/keto reductase n=1 Tax=Sinorhizobium sp. BG8 TaxID=2613773 RepID=UPI001FEDA849|nr:aldo/keto reductase [Sinorhizobium sp. BG8]
MSKGAVLAAVGSRVPERFAATGQFEGAKVETYEAVLASTEIDAVYIALPHSEHARWAIRALEAGKHVLCEKPLALNGYDAMATVAAAKASGRLLMEAFMYRLHPQYAALANLLKKGAVGRIQSIEASFGFAAEFDPDARLFKNSLGGGAIMDVGCYAVSVARMIAGLASGGTFSNPLSTEGAAEIGPSGVDHFARATLTFADGIVADISCAIDRDLDNRVRIVGETGSILIISPWLPDCWDYPAAEIVVTDADGTATSHAFERNVNQYVLEVEAAGAAIRAGKGEAAFPAAIWADSIGNMQTLDAWRNTAGLTFEAEYWENRKARFSARPLAAKFPYRVPETDRVAVGKRASAIAMGCCDIQTLVHGDHLYDVFFEAGGTIFDTAWIYEESDTALGQWMENRGVREDVIVVGKGAHSPDCFPARVGLELDESLAKLRTSYVDIYMLHRDNPEVPVGEFVDVLDAEHRAGRIRSYGFSNWTRERFDEAADYARVNGKCLPTTLSNNFSLAAMAEPVWEGCIAASSEDWKEWLRKTGTSLLAWSSQARGFFAERTASDPLADPNFARSWETPVNLGRRERARELAERIGAKTTHVALAYVLQQKLPVIPIIGPLTLDQLDDSLKAAAITLTEDDIRWLEG